MGRRSAPGLSLRNKELFLRWEALFMPSLVLCISYLFWASGSAERFERRSLWH